MSDNLNTQEKLKQLIAREIQKAVDNFNNLNNGHTASFDGKVAIDLKEIGLEGSINVPFKIENDAPMSDNLKTQRMTVEDYMRTGTYRVQTIEWLIKDLVELRSEFMDFKKKFYDEKLREAGIHFEKGLKPSLAKDGEVGLIITEHDTNECILRIVRTKKNV